MDVETYTYSDEGRVVRRELDTGADGFIDQITEFDDEGHVVRRESGIGADGFADQSTELNYDDEGRLLREETVTLGSYYLLCEYEYDAGSEPVAWRCDRDLDDDWEQIVTRARCASRT